MILVTFLFAESACPAAMKTPTGWNEDNVSIGLNFLMPKPNDTRGVQLTIRQRHQSNFLTSRVEQYYIHAVRKWLKNYTAGKLISSR